MAEERHCPEREDKSAPSGDQSDIPTNVTPPAGFVPPEPEELAKQFPQLEILELLGQGGLALLLLVAWSIISVTSGATSPGRD